MYIVDQKYVLLLSTKLDRFKRVGPHLFNFRCPFCGDSQKNARKARGYVYESKGRYAFKCHNCSQTASIDMLVQRVDSALHREYRLEKFQERGSSNTVYVDTPVRVPIEPARETLVELGLDQISTLPKTHRAVAYLTSRKIPIDRWSDLFYCRDMSVFEKMNDAYRGRLMPGERIVIPYRNERGDLTGVNGRDLGASKLRYIAVRLSSDPMIYGLDRIDRRRRIYVVEGQFDSMLVENAVAAGGTDFHRAVDMFPIESTTLVFDNQPRNTEVVKMIERMAQAGHTCVIWPQTWNYKDINEAVMDGLSRSEVMHVINSSARKDLELRLAIRDWKRV